jgi:cytidylate kinase
MMDSTGKGRGIALIGYRATGKSTVGRLLADRLNRPFADAGPRRPIDPLDLP